MSPKPHYTYRWVDRTFDLEDKVADLKREIRRLDRELAKYTDFKNDAFDDGMGGW